MIIDDEDFCIEHITQEGYMELREEFEDRVVKYVDSVMRQGVNQDMVMFLIQSMDGVVSFYRKESETSVCYDYAIGLRADYVSRSEEE